MRERAVAAVNDEDVAGSKAEVEAGAKREVQDLLGQSIPSWSIKDKQKLMKGSVRRVREKLQKMDKMCVESVLFSHNQIKVWQSLDPDRSRATVCYTLTEATQ